MINDGAFELLRHYLPALPEVMLREFALVLQGRPRFCANFVAHFAINGGNENEARALFASYVYDATYNGWRRIVVE